MWEALIFQRTCINISINLHGILAIYLVSHTLSKLFLEMVFCREMHEVCNVVLNSDLRQGGTEKNISPKG